MGSKSIEERISAVFEFLCERENLNPETLKRNDGISALYTRDERNIEELKETIDYLKSYAKIKAISQLLGNEESVRKDIVEAKEHFQKLIEDTEKEIAELPKAPRKRKSTNIPYDFGNSFEEFATDEVTRAREDRKNRLIQLRKNISLYKSKIRELDDLDRTLSNPRKVVQKLFLEEGEELKGQYGRLVNMCALSMNSDSLIKLIPDHESEAFERDGNNYTVNDKEARKFLSIIKSKKAVLAIANYATSADRYNSKKRLFDNYSTNQKKYAAAYEIADTEEFAEITKKMNEISEMFGKLEDAEEIASRGTIIHRARNFIRRVLDLRPVEVMYPKRLFRMKDELVDKMKETLEYSNKNETTKRAFEAYLFTRKNVGEGKMFDDRQHMEWAKDSIRLTGADRIDIPRDTVTIEELKESAKKWELDQAEKAKQIETELRQNQEEKDEVYEALPQRAKKILETSTPEEILGYAKKYHGFGEEINNRKNNLSSDISPSAGALILEGIIKKRQIPWEKMLDVFGEVVDKEKEQINLEKMMSDKVDYLRSSIAKMVSENPRRNEAKEDQIPEETERDAI